MKYWRGPLLTVAAILATIALCVAAGLSTIN